MVIISALKGQEFSCPLSFFILVVRLALIFYQGYLGSGEQICYKNRSLINSMNRLT